MQSREVLRSWLQRARYEVLPLPGVVTELAAIPAATVTVTASRSQGMSATLDVAEQIAGLGHRVVPHLAARMIHDDDELHQLVDRFHVVGIRDVFVVAGDSDRPAGRFASALDVLDTLEGLAPELHVGVAGYSEAHPKITDDLTRQALNAKADHAEYVVSQICFDAPTVTGWIGDVRARGVDLPVLVGVPGPVPTRRLLKIGTRIGVGQSLRFLTSHPGLSRLIRPGAYDPVPFLTAAAAADHRPDGMHLYTFNEVAATEAWRQGLLNELSEPFDTDRRWVG